MMKYVSLAVVFLTATGLGIAFQRGLSGLTEASVAEPKASPERSAIDHLLAEEKEAPEGACLVVPTSSPPSDDLQFARLSAEMGRKLLDRARQTPTKVLLEQAAAHFRACLTHEPMASDAGSLFEEVRASLAGIDREMAHLDRPGVAKAIPKTPASPGVGKGPPEAVKAVVKSPEPSAPVESASDDDGAKPQKPERLPETLMFGPDGVPIRRVDSHE